MEKEKKEHKKLKILAAGDLHGDQRLAESLAKKAEKQSFSVGKKLFTCGSGTKWDAVTITLVADDTVRITTPKTKKRYTYHELGMNDKRSADRPTMLWELLKLFAQRTGVIHSENVKYDPKLPDTAKRLNNHLKNLFGIDESIYRGHYRKEKAYITKIKFEDETH